MASKNKNKKGPSTKYNLEKILSLKRNELVKNMWRHKYKYTLNDIHLFMSEFKRRMRYCNKTNQVHSRNSQLTIERITNLTIVDGI